MQEQGAPDEFSLMQTAIERLTGFPQTQRDIMPINEMLKAGITEEDIAAAITFLKSVGNTPRGAADLQKSAMTAKGKRIQKNNGRKVEQYVGPNGEVIEL